MNNQKHYAAAISAFVIWGFLSIPLRYLRAYSSGEILYYRILVSFIILLVVVGLFRRNALKRDINTLRTISTEKMLLIVGLTLAGGLLLTVNWLTFIYIVNHINIKTASFSYLICPVITAVLGYVLIRERLTRLQWIAVGLCALSCVLIGLHSALELGYSFLTAVTYALYLISQRRNQGFDRMVVLGVQVAFSLVILSTAATYLVKEIPQEISFYWTIFLIAAVFTVLPLFLNLFALNRIKSATIGILMYINPIFNFTIAIVVFKEEVTLMQLSGYVIILAALVIFNYPIIRQLSAQWAARGS